MTNITKNAAMLLAMVLLAAGVAGCQKEEGPAERAGRNMDNAMEKAGESIERAGEKVQDAARDAKN